MNVQNKVVIELTAEEAIQLAKVLPLNAIDLDDDEVLAYNLRVEICDQLHLKSWDL